MKSEKLDLNQINRMSNTNDFAAVAAEVENKLPADAVKLDKTLLPSRGKLYPNDIYVKKLSTLNIKNLSTLNESNGNFVLNSVLSSCVFGIKTDDILVGDKLWLIFYLRAYTYDDFPFKIKHKCEHCENTVSLTYTLKNLKVDYLDKPIPNEIALLNGDNIKIKFPTIKSEAQNNRLVKSPDIIENINPELLNFAQNIAEINGKKVNVYPQAYEYVCNMDAQTFSKLVNDLTEYQFTVRPYAEFECPECGETVLETVPFSPVFFLPKL